MHICTKFELVTINVLAYLSIYKHTHVIICQFVIIKEWFGKAKSASEYLEVCIQVFDTIICFYNCADGYEVISKKQM